MTAFYNENDPFPAQWLRNLIAAGHIPDGVVDDRSITELEPQTIGDGPAHFFAGVGGWAYALRLAGVPDSARVWTGSCPCQPFSTAGKRGEHLDSRHLWPAWFALIRERRPVVVFGEQVADGAGRSWLGAVQDDLEAIGYAFGAAVLPAASVGAPHGRHRTFFGAYDHARGRAFLEAAGIHGDRESGRDPDRRGGPSASADTDSEGRERGLDTEGNGTSPECGGPTVERSDPERGSAERWGYNVGAAACGPEGKARERERVRDDAGAGGEPVQRADSDDDRRRSGHGEAGEARGALGVRTGADAGDGGTARVGNEPQRARLEGLPGDVRDWRGPGWLEPFAARSVAETGATRGFWGDCDWWWGRDGKWRPAGPGIQPLAHGVSGRVGRLRAYGNAIVPEAAAAFVRAFLGGVTQ